MKHLKSIMVSLITALVVVLALIGCTQEPEREIVEVEVTVEVPFEVTRIVERIVEVPVDNDGEAIEVVIATPTPEPLEEEEAEPTPPARVTPAVVGEIGDFDEDDLEKLLDVWELVESDFFGPIPTDENLTDALIEQLVDELGDPFTNYWPPDVAQRINDGFRGDFQGIGAYVGTNDDNQFYIVRPIPNTPAARAGLKPGDVVTHVDGNSIAGFITDEVVAIVRGPKGEPVVLTVIREGTPEPFDVTIIRDQITVPVVEIGEYADGQIGYVRLTSFNQLATEQLTLAVQAHLDNGITGLIFDLRQNGGGLLTQAVSVGDIFLPDGTYLIVRDNDGNEDRYETENGQIGEDIPLVVLIDNGSASASEIASAALKELDRATIIGVNTFGKGSVQTPYQLDDGSEFRVTTARFFSPLNNVIHGVGVSPDIEFDHTPDLFGGEDDLTIQRAVDFLLTGE